MKWEGEKTIDIVRKMKEKGISQKKICVHLHISPKTFYKWREEKSEFRDMLKECNKVLSDSLDAPLLKLAKGFKTTETTEELGRDGELHVTKRVKKRVPPNLGAIQFMKNNLDPKQWRQRKGIEDAAIDARRTYILPVAVIKVLQEVETVDVVASVIEDAIEGKTE